VTIEYRNVQGNASASGTKLHGQVTPFNSVTVIGDLRADGFREQIAPGAANKTLREQDIVLLWNHNTDEPLARMSAGNLRLTPTQLGLQYEAEPVQTQRGQDALKLAQAKVVKGMSFGFQVIRDSWTDDAGNPSDKSRGTNRTIHEMRMNEVSIVTFPAYLDTSVNVRSMTLAEQKHAAASGVEAVALARGVKAVEDSHDRHIRSVMEAHMTDEERAASKPYGDVPYADPKNGKYPIDIKHVKAAWAYINQKKNAAKYPLNGVTLASVRARIKAAMKKFGFLSGSAGEENAFEFVNPEWRSDDPYFDEWYEIDADPDEVDDDEGDEARDVQDGDDPSAAFYDLWSNGAIGDLCNLVDADAGAQIPANVREALAAVKAYRESLVASQAGGQGGQGQDAEGGDGPGGAGETPATKFGPADERTLEDNVAEMQMRAEMMKAQARLMAIQLGEVIG
jgi:uncharacterized protein